MGNAIGLGWTCAGLGIGALTLGVLGLLGLLPTAASVPAGVVVAIGFALLGLGAVLIMTAAVGEAIKDAGKRERRAERLQKDAA